MLPGVRCSISITRKAENFIRDGRFGKFWEVLEVWGNPILERLSEYCQCSFHSKAGPVRGHCTLLTLHLRPTDMGPYRTQMLMEAQFLMESLRKEMQLVQPMQLF